MATKEFQLIPFLGLLSIVVVFLFLLALLSFKLRVLLFKKILGNRGFYLYNYNESARKIVKESVRAVIASFVGGGGYRSRYFPKIEGKTLKNKSLLITQEKLTDYPHYQLVFVLRNPKVHFPSFKLSKSVSEKTWVPKKVEERDITAIFSLVTNDRDLVLTKLQTYSMKKHYKKMAKQVFEVDYDEKLQTMTVFANRFYAGVREVLDFMLTLDEAIEDYKKTSIDIEKTKETIKEPSRTISNNLKIYNIISLINTTKTKEKCVVCWSKIDYSTETLLFECCSGYTHLDHGIDWIYEKEKCPKCGSPNPYTIQLPIIVL